MSPHRQLETSDVSRRSFVELGTISGLGALAMLSGGVGPAEAAFDRSAGVSQKDLGAKITGLSYVGFDALAFWPIIASQRIYQDATGVQGNADDRIWAPLSLPVGSTISQISASYQNQPIMEISRRLLFSGTSATAPEQVFQQSFPASPGGPFASTFNLSPALAIATGYTYLISAFLTPGSSIFGVQIGYRPPTQSFKPFPGSTPRVFSGALVAGQPQTVFLGNVGARSGVFNLNVSGSTQAGSVSAFPANSASPSGIPSVHYSVGQKVENLVITGMDATGSITLLATTAINAAIDVIGYLN